MATMYATLVECPGCGRTREVSSRHARRNARCRDCLRGHSKPPVPTDTERRFWLDRFSDEEIVELALAMWGERGRIECVRSYRLRLTDVL